MSRITIKNLNSLVSRINEISLNKVELDYAYGGVKVNYSISHSTVVPTGYTTKKEISLVLFGMLAGLRCARG